MEHSHISKTSSSKNELAVKVLRLIILFHRIVYKIPFQNDYRYIIEYNRSDVIFTFVLLNQTVVNFSTDGIIT